MNKNFALIGIMAVIILAVAIVLYVQQPKGTDTGGMYVKNAIPIYETNQNIDSDSKAQEVFNENFDLIIDATKQTLKSTACDIFPNASVCYNMSEVFFGIKIPCIENNKILFDKIKFERRAYQKGDKPFGSFWHGYFDKEQYTFKVYIIEQGEEWKEENGEIYTSTTTCKDPAEAGSINVETGELYCASGITQSWKLSYNLKFIMDSKGTVYLAGEYCPK